jgi:hypothetical protein
MGEKHYGDYGSHNVPTDLYAAAAKKKDEKGVDIEAEMKEQRRAKETANVKRFASTHGPLMNNTTEIPTSFAHRHITEGGQPLLQNNPISASKAITPAPKGPVKTGDKIGDYPVMKGSDERLYVEVETDRQDVKYFLDKWSTYDHLPGGLPKTLPPKFR